MSRARSRRQQLALAAIPEDEPAVPAAVAGPVAEIMQLIDGLEAAGEGWARGQPRLEAYAARAAAGADSQQCSPLLAVDEKVGTIMSAAEDAVLALKNECKRLLVLLPAKVLLPGALPLHGSCASLLGGAVAGWTCRF